MYYGGGCAVWSGEDSITITEGPTTLTPDTAAVAITYSDGTRSSTKRNLLPDDGWSTKIDRYCEIASIADNVQLDDDGIIGGVNYSLIINSDEDLTPGSVGCAKITFVTNQLDKSFLGRKFTWSQKREDQTQGYFKQKGVFTITSIGRTENRSENYHVEAYDNMVNLDMIVDEWVYKLPQEKNDYRVYNLQLDVNYTGTQYYSDGYRVYYRRDSSTDITSFTYDTTNKKWVPQAGGWDYYDNPTQAEFNTLKGRLFFLGHNISELEYACYWPDNASSSVTVGSGSFTMVNIPNTDEVYFGWHDDVENEQLKTYDTPIYPNEGFYFDGATWKGYYRTYHEAGLSSTGLRAGEVLKSLGHYYNLDVVLPAWVPPMVYFGFTTTGITGRTLLSWLAQMCGCSAVCDSNGALCLVRYMTNNSGEQSLDSSQYVKYEFKDFETPLIGRFIIKESDSDDVGYIYQAIQDNNNTFAMVGNPFITSATDSQKLAELEYLKDVLNRILGSYYPMTVTLLQDYGINVGDIVVIDGKRMPVMQKDITSTGAVITSRGQAVRTTTSASAAPSVNFLNGKDIVITSYDSAGNVAAQLRLDGSDGSIYMTTSETGHVYINGVQID